MVGQIGAQASAAVGLTTSTTWLINSPMFAFGVGVLACISEALGANDKDRAKTAGCQAVYITLVLGVLLGAVTLAVSPVLPEWLGAEQAVRQDASVYFSIICLPMVFRASSIVFGAVLRGAGDSKSPMLANLCMNAVNVVLNFILIYSPRSITLFGKSIPVWGASMGITGAAVATAVAYVVGGSLMFCA